MQIDNYCTVSYILDGYEITKNSNTVSVGIINPIIIFKKCICGDNVKIYIKNNSGKRIYNIIYQECIKNIFLVDILVNNLLKKNVNIKKGVYLGDLDNSEIKILQYKKFDNCNNPSLLCYKIIIQDELNQIYVLDN